MPTAKSSGVSAAGVRETLRELFSDRLPELWAQQAKGGAPPLFQSGIEFISVTVKSTLVEVSLTIAGKDSPKILQGPMLARPAEDLVVRGKGLN